MAKISTIVKNNRREKLADKFESKRAELRRAAVNPELSDDERDAARLKLHKMPRDTSRIRVKSRCALTGRGRGVYRKFKLSRM